MLERLKSRRFVTENVLFKDDACTLQMYRMCTLRRVVEGMHHVKSSSSVQWRMGAKKAQHNTTQHNTTLPRDDLETHLTATQRPPSLPFLQHMYAASNAASLTGDTSRIISEARHHFCSPPLVENTLLCMHPTKYYDMHRL